MKQTAVEWLIEEIKKPNKDVWYWDAIFNQAKEMEKKQLNDFWDESRIEYMGDNYLGKQIDFDEYYNKTFKNQ